VSARRTQNLNTKTWKKSRESPLQKAVQELNFSELMEGVKLKIKPICIWYAAELAKVMK
jgi:hypothetical protein